MLFNCGENPRKGVGWVARSNVPARRSRLRVLNCLISASGRVANGSFGIGCIGIRQRMEKWIPGPPWNLPSLERLLAGNPSLLAGTEFQEGQGFGGRGGVQVGQTAEARIGLSCAVTPSRDATASSRPMLASLVSTLKPHSILTTLEKTQLRASTALLFGSYICISMGKTVTRPYHCFVQASAPRILSVKLPCACQTVSRPQHERIGPVTTI